MLLTAVLAACGRTGGGAASDDPAGRTTGAAGTDELTGTFEGFFHFEAQCFYIVAGDRKLSLSVPDGYSIEPDRPWDLSSSEEAQPVLHGSDGAVIASDGETITVTGTIEALPPDGPCGTTEIFRADTVTTA